MKWVPGLDHGFQQGNSGFKLFESVALNIGLNGIEQTVESASWAPLSGRSAYWPSRKAWVFVQGLGSVHFLKRAVTPTLKLDKSTCCWVLTS